MVKQQLQGIITLALPVIGIYLLYPAFLLHPLGQFFCALLVGGYIWYLTKNQNDTLKQSLLYAPTGETKNMLEAYLNAAGIPAQNIILRYAYTGEQIALNLGNMIVIDPVLFSLCEEDPQAQAVRAIYEQQIAPTLTLEQKEYLAQVRQALNIGAERFIFMHELGHFVDKFIEKKIVSVFIAGGCAAYIGIRVGIALLPFGGLYAVLGGMLFGGLMDIVLAYVTNAFFKLRAEKNADTFAVRHVPHDVADAAAFFIQHQQLLNARRANSAIFKLLPSELLTGYQDGNDRARRIRKLAQ